MQNVGFLNAAQLILHLIFCRHGKDVLFTDESAKHMLVIRNGHMYIFDAIDRDGMLY